ncbi:MAG: glycine zipper family protein [Xanthomonadales bacterium]|nr:glycine zipper family protein [Xanthomonadales bacterium]
MRQKLFAASLMIMLSSTAIAAKVIVYPAGGQSAEQQQSDEGACLSWAKEQTGFDPTAPMQTTSPPPEYSEPTTSAGRGALRGALGGLAIGAIAGNAGKGAAIGAGTGALVGGVRRHEQTERAYEEQDAWAQQQAAEYQQSQNQFNRAYATCLEGRGYTVN